MLERFSVKTRLILYPVIPLLALLGLTAFSFTQYLAELQSLQRAKTLITLGLALSETAHELQKERGMSSGFLASQGAKFADRLPGQRKAADAQIARLQEVAATLKLEQLSPDYQQTLQAALANLKERTGLHQRIDRLQLRALDAFTTYTDLIDGLLEAALRSSNELTDAQLVRLTNAKSVLMLMKEHIGQERALLSAAFSAGQLSQPNYRLLLELLSAQEYFQHLSLAFALPEQRAALAFALDHPTVREVESIERLVRNTGPNAELNYSAETWFEQITVKIDRLRTVEELLSRDIQSTADRLIGQTKTILLGFGALFVLALALTIVLGGLIARSLLRQMGGELGFAVKVAQAIASGMLDTEIHLQAGDKTSLLASMKHMQQELRNRIETEQRLVAEAQRIQSALDKAATQIMAVGPDERILYMNAAMNRLLQEIEPEIRKHLPEFRADRLLGAPWSALQTSGHRSVLSENRAEQVDEVQLGGRLLRRVITPVINDQGERLGTVIEWTDRTNEARVEQELAALLESALQGDFSVRLDLAGKTGFFRQLSAGLNQILEIVSSSLNDLARVLKSIAQGDLTQGIEHNYAGIFEELKSATDTTLKRLCEIVGQIRETSTSISNAAQEIAAGNADLSRRTESQAGSLEQATSAMEELSATVKHNAENAQQANELALAANQRIQASGQTVRAVVGTMGEIQDSSRRIADIIGVIDAIAFQTNILALNAAVEAARAGEQGRGFAVVAAEVRNLAQRSAQAAKEIKQLILDSIGKIEGGVKLAHQAGAEMNEVVSRFDQIAERIAEIARATLDQSAGISQMTRTIAQLDEMTQQNAALVEQAAAATESLEEQARELVDTVSIFRLELSHA
ncbi:methyl-accepting chemotaxis protein [Caldichromatium japonicum]|uniref:Methyl-accepting chemotaxis protein n=1 Tax=Caldichromatium japonicum TaxID=2699430 RepID=A0A6G7VEQ6_9GAMM|nr:nitrate- and nitrite sensing domain-containing protein [Caldichromatium japonicum]QIK38277.1 methyl-accepting chemotaxis protein [Caldichromatium japonicum]